MPLWCCTGSETAIRIREPAPESLIYHFLVRPSQYLSEPQFGDEYRPTISNLSFQNLRRTKCQEMAWNSRGCKICLDLTLLLSHVSRVRLHVTPKMAAHQAPIPGILQARILEWVAIANSLGGKTCLNWHEPFFCFLWSLLMPQSVGCSHISLQKILIY